MRTRRLFQLHLAAALAACAGDDDDESTSSPTQASAVTVASTPASDGDDDGSADGGGIDCAFPNDPSICGCGNACVGDPESAAYGTCRDCGSGVGCSTENTWCCSDGDCPSGTLCTTLSSSADIGYHICVPASDLDGCATVDDCYPGEECAGGYCRDGE